MTTLLVRHAHSRFQLRRGTGPTTVIGGVMTALAAVGLFSALASGPTHLGPSLVEGLVALGLGFGGLRVMNSGALLLESEAGGTFIASLGRTVKPQEVRGAQVRWRFDAQRDKEVEVRLTLEAGSADVTQGWLPHPDPDALGKALGAALGLATEVEQDASEAPRL